MPYDPTIHHRRSIRLRGYDYTQAGAYFITICVQGRECLFGKVVNAQIVLNDAGRMVQTQWEQLPERFNTIELDIHVVMPNHFHGIIITNPVGAGLVSAPGATTRVAPTGPRRPTLGDIIGAFKSLTTNAYIRGVRECGWPPFDKRLWQRNYYEHIIRDAADLERIRKYIANNPAKWPDDRLYTDTPP